MILQRDVPGGHRANRTGPGLDAPQYAGAQSPSSRASDARSNSANKAFSLANIRLLFVTRSISFRSVQIHERLVIAPRINLK